MCVSAERWRGVPGTKRRVEYGEEDGCGETAENSSCEHDGEDKEVQMNSLGAANREDDAQLICPNSDEGPRRYKASYE